MKYMGSKARIANEILPIILKNRHADSWYVEPFVGGCNAIDKVTGRRLGNDINPYLISMWNALVYNEWKPSIYNKEEHAHIRLNKGLYPQHVVGWVGFNCSYSGVFFGGFAGQVKTKTGLIRNYQDEAIRNVQKQIPMLNGITFTNNNYQRITIPDNSIVYCDPPYKSTSAYKIGAFNHNEFWEWVRKISIKNQVFISEYTAPSDFECLWSKAVKSSLSANGKSGGNKDSVEKLFKLR